MLLKKQFELIRKLSHTMWFRLSKLYPVMCLILFVRQLQASKYRFVYENEDIFADCANQPNNVFNLEGLANISELTITQQEDVLKVSGNATFIWNIRPGDRIQVSYVMYRFDCESWMQTPFALTILDLCPILYDKHQYWYKFWTKHITNQKDIKDECLNPGTKLVHEPFELDWKLEAIAVPLDGRYKIEIKIKAFNSMNLERETSICADVIGEFQRL